MPASSACAGGADASPRPVAKLRWARPRLVNPIRVRVTNPTREIKLAPDRDYVLKMPSTPVKPGPSGGLRIEGGHNVVLVGGEIDFDSVDDPDEIRGRVAAIFDNTGIVHIEGLYAHGRGLVEGIQNYSERSIVQVENCRFEHLHGSEDTYHSDLFQFNVGDELRVDRFTGSSSYQGFFVTDMTGHVYISRTNIVGDRGAQYLFWQGDAFVPQTLSRFYIKPAPGRSLGASIWPGIWDSDPSKRPHHRRPHAYVWGPTVHVTGMIRKGRPRRGDFVPRGVAGTRYRSPGYL